MNVGSMHRTNATRPNISRKVVDTMISIQVHTKVHAKQTASIMPGNSCVCRASRPMIKNLQYVR